MGKHLFKLFSSGINKNSQITCRTSIMLWELEISATENKARMIMNKIKYEQYSVNSLSLKSSWKLLLQIFCWHKSQYEPTLTLALHRHLLISFTITATFTSSWLYLSIWWKNRISQKCELGNFISPFYRKGNWSLEEL